MSASENNRLSFSNIFKRNRTLTGTTSNFLNSIDAKSDLKSPRTHVHHLSIQRSKIISILLIVIVLSSLLWVLIINFTARVSVDLSSMLFSNQVVDSLEYENTIQEYLVINPMSRLNFLLDQSALTNYVSLKLPEVASVDQEKMVGIGETKFTITMRKPTAGWKINDKQYYVDSNGISFEKNYYSEPIVQIVDNSGASLQTGTAIASNRFLGYVGRVVSSVSASGYTVTEAMLPMNTTRELDVRLKENNFLIKISIDRPVGEQVEDMARAAQYFISHNQIPNYIDVRVSGKAFYK